MGLLARTIRRLQPRERFLGLLVALWAALLLPHVFQRLGARVAELLTTVAFVVLLARSLAFEERMSRVGHASLWGLVAAVLLRESFDLDSGDPYAWVLLLLELSVTGGVTYEVFRYLATPAPVDRDKLYAAACGYLLMGLLFATGFELVELLEPGGLSETLSERAAYRYFSFVTLSTLGYGDLVPKLPLARMIAVSEAVLGQLYLAVVVALLVGRLGQAAPRE